MRRARHITCKLSIVLVLWGAAASCLASTDDSTDVIRYDAEAVAHNTERLITSTPEDPATEARAPHWTLAELAKHIIPAYYARLRSLSWEPELLLDTIESDFVPSLSIGSELQNMRTFSELLKECGLKLYGSSDGKRFTIKARS